VVTGEHETNSDGRRARRERTRLAVVDAVFAAIQDGKIPPTVDDVAERAGVSVSSVFRNFDGLDDLQRQAFDRFQEQFAHLLDLASEPGLDRWARVRHFVGSRIELYESAGPLIHVARQRALDYQPMAEGGARLRSRLSDHARRHFVTEASLLPARKAAELLAVLDATTSPEAFEVMSATHGRTARQIERTWVDVVGVLVDRWAGVAEPIPTGPTDHA
jgi:TetR/AcrR family transcriptional regulator, regulator of autoinduction and epiphytic fitness